MKDRKEWRAPVQTKLNEFYADILLALCSLGPSSRALVVVTWRRVGCCNLLLHDAVWINCKKGATSENQGSGVKYMG